MSYHNQIMKAIQEEIERTTVLTQICSCVGYWINLETGYRIEFSTKKLDWSCDSYDQLIILPPLEHPQFPGTFRHELIHAKVNNWFLNKPYFFWRFFLFLTSAWLFDGFYELFVNIKARTVFITYFDETYWQYTWKQLGISCFWSVVLLGFLFDILTV